MKDWIFENIEIIPLALAAILGAGFAAYALGGALANNWHTTETTAPTLIQENRIPAEVICWSEDATDGAPLAPEAVPVEVTLIGYPTQHRDLGECAVVSWKSNNEED